MSRRMLILDWAATLAFGLMLGGEIWAGLAWMAYRDACPTRPAPSAAHRPVPGCGPGKRPAPMQPAEGAGFPPAGPLRPMAARAALAALLWPSTGHPCSSAPCGGPSGERGEGGRKNTRSQRAALPTDPFRRCATKALRGWFGPLPEWKRRAYRWGLEHGIEVQGKAKRTTYCPHCSPSMLCADGSKVRRGICAASPNIPMHSIVWLASDGLLLVTDRGGAVKARRPYVRPGESANFDVWVPRCPVDCWRGPGTRHHVPYAVLGHVREVTGGLGP